MVNNNSYLLSYATNESCRLEIHNLLNFTSFSRESLFLPFIKTNQNLSTCQFLQATVKHQIRKWRSFSA
jgi:hypothetical protein